MKTLKSTLVIFLFVFGTTSCTEELINYDYGSEDNNFKNESLKSGKHARMATGSVEIMWKGGGKDGKMGSDKGSVMGNQPENLRAFFEFNANEGKNLKEAKGNIVFLVTSQDFTVHREIKAKVIEVYFMPDKPNKGWFVAKVISDSKGCNEGSGPGEHETGCSGEDHTDEGGCADDASHDSGCSHDTDEGGTDGGGCSDDHTTDEGGCSGSDKGDERGNPGSMGGTNKGNPLSGKNCRLGQLIVVKVHDMATPGMDPDGDGNAKGDALSWKWYAPDYAYDINIEPKPLCKKTIIAGNLVVHN